MADPAEIHKIQSRLREHCLWRRQFLSDAEQQLAAREVGCRVQESALLASYGRLGLYRAHRREISTEVLWQYCKREGKELFFPRLEQGHLSWARVEGPAAWERGPFGILQPTGKALSVELNHLEALIIPGVVFGRDGGRIGWGKGLYDRVLKGYGGLKMGLAYDFQVVPCVPLAPWDEKIDCLLTPEQLHFCR